MDSRTYDALVIGSGPNGLAAAVRMAQEGLKVKVVEAYPEIGGGTRTLELTLPGFKHDICSAVHPTAVSSPFLRSLPLQDYGLEWVHPELPLVHPLPDGDAVAISVSLEETLDGLGQDADAYRKLYKPFIDSWFELAGDLFAPFSLFPGNPFKMARFGFYGLRSAKSFANSMFKEERTKAMFGGFAAHSIIPLTYPGSAAFGLVLGSSLHAVGWPFAKGGSASITTAMAEYFKSLGGVIETDHKLKNRNELKDYSTVFFNTSPKTMIEVMGDAFPDRYRRKIENYTYGPGVFKIDYALSEPVPWRNEHARKAGTLHVGSSMDELAESEQMAWDGVVSEKPYLLISQQSIADTGRAPEGKHTLWVYAHCPNSSTFDMTDIIENRIEELAPGFKSIILAKNTLNTADFESYNANYVGGDINVGAATLSQLFTRPVARFSPYTTPLKGIYICSSATPPGGGVHGMCGFHAADAALSRQF
jgi:phytoene dehydrogenase-like protein